MYVVPGLFVQFYDDVKAPVPFVNRAGLAARYGCSERVMHILGGQPDPGHGVAIKTHIE